MDLMVSFTVSASYRQHSEEIRKSCHLYPSGRHGQLVRKRPGSKRPHNKVGIIGVVVVVVVVEVAAAAGKATANYLPQPLPRDCLAALHLRSVKSMIH